MFRWQKKTHNWARVGLSSLPPKIYSTMYLSMRFLQTKVVLQMILHVWIMYWIAWLFPPRSNQTEGQFLCKILHPSEESDFTNLKNIEEKAFSESPYQMQTPNCLFAKKSDETFQMFPWSRDVTNNLKRVAKSFIRSHPYPPSRWNWQFDLPFISFSKAFCTYKSQVSVLAVYHGWK